MTNPTFTNAQGNTVHYTPSLIYAVSGPGTGQATNTTFVFGICQNFFTVNSAPGTFVATLNNASNFAAFTTSAARLVWIRGDLCTSIRNLTTNEVLQNATANAAVAIGQFQWFVTDSVTAAITAINTAGGSF
jgi:hypothetical protein